MDPNLEEPLTLESAIGVDFEPSGDAVVSHADITFDSGNHETIIPMEFENINEQPILMDTGNEEIIDFMDDQLILQEYPVQEGQSSTTTTIESAQNVLTTQAETMMDLQFYPQTSAQETQVPAKVIAVKAALPSRTISVQKKIEVASTPRQVAIAPKPPKVVHGTIVQKSAAFVQGKQYAIAPKPVALVTNRTATSFMNKGGQSNLKSNAVLTQIGKQLVLVPTDGTQKIKLVSAGSSASNIQYIKADSNQTQHIAPKSVSGIQSKQVMAKIIVQSSSGGTPARIVTMQQKTVPISLANKVLMTSPTKIAKKQHIVSLKSPQKLLSTSTQGPTTKKVVITANPNVVLKTAAQPKTTQIIKDGNVVNVQQGQKTQLHQINVPGKGIQYIRLVTNANPAAAKSVQTNKAQSPVLVPSKTIVLSDNKGNLIHMPADKVLCSQPPPLVMTGKPATVKTLSAKPQKFVRLAPVSKSQLIAQQSMKPVQSLLAPITMDAPAKETIISDLIDAKCEVDAESEAKPESSNEVEVESKEALHALLIEPNAQEQEVSTHEVQIEFERQQTPPPQEKCVDHVEDGLEQELEQDVEREYDSSNEEHPLIVIPSTYLKQQYRYEPPGADDELDSYQAPHTPAPSDTDMVSNEFGMRPRKACNCTKSQCLKLYCDCFANGEFCNSCNCNNCCNNLENEEFRQQAIRGCLDRNPNAFRPKIGKSKSGGPELTRRHNKGCNCKKSGCLKNYCECYEAKIACTSTCKCVGCRNVEETLERARRRDAAHDQTPDVFRPSPHPLKQPCNFLTTEVIEAVCQCLIAAAAEGSAPVADPVRGVIEEFGRCLQDIIGASHQPAPSLLINEEGT